MSILAGLIGLIGFLFLLVAIVGLIAPSVFKDKKTGEVPKRSHFLAGGVAAAGIAFVIAGAIAPSSESPGAATPTQAEKPAASAAAPQAAEKDLGITPAQYAEHFNASMKELGQPFRMKPKVERGEVNDTFSVQLNDKIAIVGSVAKGSGKVSGVMLMGTGDGTMKSGLDIVTVAVATIAAAFPDLDRKQIGPEVMQLMKIADADEKHQAERTLNGVKMYHLRSDVMGNVFGVEPAK
jgi:hypothetical protein